MFIPRKVSRPNDVTRRLAATRPEFIQESTILQADLRSKGNPTDALPAASEELAALVHLAISKHSVWVNPELVSSDGGYVPLVRLIHESEGFTDMKTTPPEADVVRAIQKHLPDVLEARILVSPPQKFAWYPSGSRSDTTGGFEVRRKDSKTLRSESLRKQDWDAKTVYLEKLPTYIRSIAAVYRFVWSLLNSRRDCPFDAIQDVRLTAPLDGEVDSKRTFKGFAFVTLSSMDLVKQLLEDWPWSPDDRSTPASGRIPASAFADVTDARNYGVRIITKTRWEELRDEYLAYRVQLLDAVYEEDRKFGTGVQPKPGIAELGLLPPAPNDPSHSAAPQDYPRGCLVFARNIHTETNKTTLRKLFSSAVGFPQDILDYVDFNKGMDSCFLRIRSPKEASTLVEHFRINLLAQSAGLDADGVVPPAPTKHIVMELVEGKKEELYWEKVPEKARRQAIQNALGLSGDTDTPPGTHSLPSKRRRKG
ncbi:hypothetical protein BDM02DRAFT_3110066 [Thelephora ganbajun]|uniref:Uncharacterized protein n=1 Tax=Thelephora ganbajun TaxID=370292 RepID=A0ACB6ZRA4_THEGA|nr:hypothetical protein BDM02DRAFT_3110066 [Thelephora ganbajun]